MYYRIVAFARDQDDSDILAAVQRMFVRVVDGEKYAVGHTRSISCILLQPDEVVWRSMHDCVGGKCDVDVKGRRIRHRRAVHTDRILAGASQCSSHTDIYRLLTWTSGFPTRSG